jgi:hypothetical protein
MTMKEFGDFVVYGPKGNKMKTADLEGAALDWAVVKAEVITLNSDDHEPIVTNNPNHPIGINYSGERTSCFEPWSPSEDWSQGGPIIERERLWIQPEIGKEGCGNAWYAISLDGNDSYGPTPLIAAMRCYVASRLGDEVDVPEELK